MDVREATEFLSSNHKAVLVTRRRDGEPQVSPVAAGVDAAGRVVVSSRETAFKVRNLRRDPRATLCGLSDGFFGRWVSVSGTAEVVGLPEAMDLLVELYRQVQGEHPDWDEFREAMVSERRVAIVIAPAAAGPDRSG